MKVLPKRTTDDPQELLQIIESVDHILIDATERPIQRPQKPARQKKHYSGKKAAIPGLLKYLYKSVYYKSNFLA